MDGNENKENSNLHGNPHGNPDGNNTNRGRIYIGRRGNTHYRVDTYREQVDSIMYGIRALQESDQGRLASDEILGTNAQNIRR